MSLDASSTDESSPRVPTPHAWIIATLVALAALCIVVPHAVIRPFVAQDPSQLQVALWVVRQAPWLSVAIALATVAVAVARWRLPGSSARRALRRVGLALGVLVALAAVGLTRVNVYEHMFHSVRTPSFVAGATASLAPDDMVMVLRSGAVSRAYPVRAMTFHHIVNDVLDGAPIAVTYCSLCHTGVVWRRVVGGRTLTLHIGGINNQNMLMRDDETGTFWQQSTGEAVAGPLAGARLQRVFSDELSVAQWRRESPDGVALAPVVGDAGEYASADWETRMARRPSVLPRVGPLAPRALVLGFHAGGVDRALPVDRVLASSVVMDEPGTATIALLVGPDGRSVRAFDARLPGGAAPIALFAQPAHPGVWVDAEGGAWGFDGCATSGAHQTRCLAPVALMRSYWFDWRAHHPTTTVGDVALRSP